MAETPIKATCHCGAISVTAPRTPEHLNECQCTICRRYAAAWAYYSANEVTIEKRSGSNTRAYIWGDRDLEFHFCDHCGCVMYWWPIGVTAQSPGEHEMGVNSRMMDPAKLYSVNRRTSFGALRRPLRDDA